MLAKFLTNASDILFSWRDKSSFRCYTLGPLCLWQCLNDGFPNFYYSFEIRKCCNWDSSNCYNMRLSSVSFTRMNFPTVCVPQMVEIKRVSSLYSSSLKDSQFGHLDEKLWLLRANYSVFFLAHSSKWSWTEETDIIWSPRVDCSWDCK